MSNFINVEMVFDTTTLLKKYPNLSQDPKTPTGIAHTDVYMITEPRFLADPKSQATADLAIQAEQEDVIRWRGLSLSENVSQSVIPYKIDRYAGQQVTKDPVPNEATPWVPVPVKNPDQSVDPLHYNAQQIPNYFLGADITASGTENYRVYFYIAEQVSGGNVKVLGYLYWDPSITVH